MTLHDRLANLESDALFIRQQMNNPATEQTVEDWVPSLIKSVQTYLFDGVLDSRDIHTVYASAQPKAFTLTVAISKAKRMYNLGMWSEQEAKLHILTQTMHLLQHTDALQHLDA
jgi:hypothetical protein